MAIRCRACSTCCRAAGPSPPRRDSATRATPRTRPGCAPIPPTSSPTSTARACSRTAQALDLRAADAQALLRPLKPLFGDAGFPIDAPVPSRWYLRLPQGAKLPVFTPPEQALGADLFDELPQGPEGRRWRALLSEAQVVLHNHPLNAQRAAAGLAPVNSLWFWGAGALPDRVASHYAHIASDDEALTALAALGGTTVEPRASAWQGAAGQADRLFDLRDARDLAVLERDWFAPLLAAVAKGQVKRLRMEFADGARYDVDRSQRWRFWRRALASFVRVA